jgi:hypothetical protein
MANIGTATNKKLLDLFNSIKSGDLILRPSFQRKLVWNNNHKETFIETILKGLPFPEIYLADGEIDLKSQRSKTLVVDGQQRLSTIYQYITGDEKFKIKKIQKFNDLTDTEKTNFYDYLVVVRDLGRIDDEKISEIFKRINSVQYALNSMEIHNALYEGEFITCAKELLKNSDFYKLEIFSENEYSRMRDWEFILIIMATIEEGGYFNSTKEVEKYIVKYDEEYQNKDQITNEIKDSLGILGNLKLNNDSFWYNKSVIYSLIVELIKFKKKNGFFPDLKNLISTLKKLENDILNNKSQENTEYFNFYKYIYSATASRTGRIERGKLIEKYINKLI